MASGQQARAAFEQVFRQFRDQARKSGMGGNGGGGGQGGGPNLGGLLGGGAGLALLIGGGLAINSSLFNGACAFPVLLAGVADGSFRPVFAQWMVVIVPSSIRESAESSRKSSTKEPTLW